MFSTLAIFGLPQGSEFIFLGILGLLLFGKRLPEVGRGIGQGILEFKKGLKGVASESEDGHQMRPAAALPKSEPVRLEPPRSESGQETRVSRSDSVE